ncbi:adenylyl-sulfate kinase [Streptomyces sp. NPDC059175]|uniref:adenylyl-sulfate kinase n=1 Tax=unclassified Streptomyces TaxID=2593676 RepID=UPI0036BD6E82
MDDDGLICGCAGATVWFTGPPGAGKTTVAQALAGALRARRHRVEILDGDPRHATLPTGPARDDPDRHTERTGLAAEVLARNGFLTLVSATAPGAASRDAVRRRHEATGTPYVEIHLDAPQSVCAKRRPTGAPMDHGAPTPPEETYEPPPAPDLRLITHHMSVSQTAAAVYALLADMGVVRSRCVGPTDGTPPDPLAGQGVWPVS